MLILKHVSFKSDEDDPHVINIVVPTHIEDNITAVSPMFTNSGSFYKNITLLENKYGQTFKVVGNYKNFIYLVDKCKPKIGYK